MVKHVNFFAAMILILFMGLKMEAKEYESPAYTQYANEVTSSFLKQMKKEFGLECQATGGKMPYDVEEISVQLIANRGATVEEARELEIKTTERFVQIINAHEKIRPFLREQPFLSNRVRVAISFYKPKNAPYTIDSVDLVYQAKGRIYYRAKNLDNPYTYRGIKDESYEDALKIVQSNAANNISQSQEAPKTFKNRWPFKLFQK